MSVDRGGQVLDLLRASANGMTYQDLTEALPDACEHVITAALHHLHVRALIWPGEDRRWRAAPARDCDDQGGDNGKWRYESQRTRPGGVMTAKGWIPYYRHPSGWDLPVRLDDDGMPVRRNRRLVYVQPDGSDFQPEDEQSLDRKVREAP